MEAALDQPVLVLNRLWQAVNVVGARRAFGLLARGHAHVVHQQEDDFRMFSMMDWIDFSDRQPAGGRDGDRPHADPDDPAAAGDPADLLRQAPVQGAQAHAQQRLRAGQELLPVLRAVFPREQLNLDHVIPRDYGGKTTWENIVCSCIRCNTRKANRLPHEAGMRLIRKPSRPKWRPVISMVLGNQHREIWKDFLDIAYWNVELEE
jgi:5-methylcytosine-specific restriction endonuclease McrA